MSFAFTFRRAMRAAGLAAVLLAGSTMASATPTGGTARTELIMLGSGGGPQIRKDRSEPAVLLIVNGTSYLIDCGSGTLRRMVEAGIDSTRVKTIFITHQHADHVMGLADVMADSIFSSSSALPGLSLNIYGPPRTAQLVDAAVNYIMVPYTVFAQGKLVKDESIRHRFVAHDIDRPGLVYEDQNIKVIAAENSHFQMMPDAARRAEKSYAYRVETPQGVIAFTGDTGPSEAVAKLAEGADLLVSEVINDKPMVERMERLAAIGNWSPERKAMVIAHMQRQHLVPSAVAQLASQARVKSVLLYHIVPGTDHDETEVAAGLAVIKAGFSGEVISSRDLNHFCLVPGNANGKVLSECQ